MSRQLALTWGVESIIVEGAANTDQMVDAIDATIRAHGIARPGDLVVVVAGAPIGADQAINTVMVHQVGGKPS